MGKNYNFDSDFDLFKTTMQLINVLLFIGLCYLVYYFISKIRSLFSKGKALISSGWTTVCSAAASLKASACALLSRGWYRASSSCRKLLSVTSNSVAYWARTLAESVSVGLSPEEQVLTSVANCVLRSEAVQNVRDTINSSISEAGTNANNMIQTRASVVSGKLTAFMVWAIQRMIVDIDRLWLPYSTFTSPLTSSFSRNFGQANEQTSSTQAIAVRRPFFQSVGDILCGLQFIPFQQALNRVPLLSYLWDGFRGPAEPTPTNEEEMPENLQVIVR